MEKKFCHVEKFFCHVEKFCHGEKYCHIETFKFCYVEMYCHMEKFSFALISALSNMKVEFRLFVAKSVLLQFTLICRKISFDAIYALLCGEKFSQQSCLWRKNTNTGLMKIREALI